jgi:hypothetical protein
MGSPARTGLYDKWILPRLTDLAMRRREATRYRSQIVPQACGVVLEIGAGSGLNLPFYGAGVTRLIARVLKLSGTLLFAEHGLAPDANVRTWQERLNPLWQRFTGGCNLNRKMDGLIQASGFRIVQLDLAYARGLRPMSYVYSGRAQPESLRTNNAR